jgi:predicted dehydrogenase
MVPSDTYDNATLLAAVEQGTYEFPLTLQMKRIAPGEANTWRIRAVGMKGGVEFSTRYPKTVWLFRFEGGRQSWSQVEVGSQSTFPTITIPAVEFGFTDSVLQMWAAYLTERAGDLGDRFGCATPQEALLAHRVVAAALKSSATSQAVAA